MDELRNVILPQESKRPAWASFISPDQQTVMFNSSAKVHGRICTKTVEVVNSTTLAYFLNSKPIVSRFKHTFSSICELSHNIFLFHNAGICGGAAISCASVFKCKPSWNIKHGRVFSRKCSLLTSNGDICKACYDIVTKPKG